MPRLIASTYSPMYAAHEKLIGPGQARGRAPGSLLRVFVFIRIAMRLVFNPASLSRDVWWGVRRRLYIAFIELIPAFLASSALAVVLGYWVLSEAALRYGVAEFIADAAAQGLLLALGHTLALVFLLLRLAPSAFLDISARNFSGEMLSLESMRIDLDRFLVLPWLLAAPLIGLAFFSIYCGLFFCIGAVIQPVAEALGVAMVEIDTVRVIDFYDLSQTAVRVAVEAILIALFSIFFALHGTRDAANSPLALLRAIGAVRALNLMLTALVIMKIVSFLLL